MTRITESTTRIGSVAAAAHRPAGSPVAVGGSMKDRWFSALVLAIAAAAWFGWGMMAGVAELPLILGWALAIAMIVVVVIHRSQARGPVAMHSNPAVRATYWRWVLAETVLIVGGNLTLTAIGQVGYQPAWTLAVVGAHFIPLARAFRLGELVTLGLACVVAAGCAAAAGLTGLAKVPTLAGGLGGALMLVVAGYSVVRIHRAQRA